MAHKVIRAFSASRWNELPIRCYGDIVPGSSVCLCKRSFVFVLNLLVAVLSYRFCHILTSAL